MARTVHVYPKAIIDGSTWTLFLDVSEGGVQEDEPTFTAPAGLVATSELRLLKVSFDLILDDTDTAQDVLTALTVDDIQPGPQTLTTWEDWQDSAEGIIAGLTSPYDESDFWAAWTGGDTQAMRNSANRALVSGPGGIGRGWTVLNVHQHEGDGTFIPPADGGGDG